MESVKLKIINLLLKGLKVVALKLLFYQAKYNASEEVGRVVKNQKFDMRGMASRMKAVMLHDQDIIDKRWAECEKCEFLETKEKLGKVYHNCTKCGCFIKVGENHIKTRVATVACPIGKWDKEYNFMEGRATNGSQPVVK